MDWADKEASRVMNEARSGALRDCTPQRTEDLIAKALRMAVIERNYNPVIVMPPGEFSEEMKAKLRASPPGTIESSAPQWTREPPSVPGWYWIVDPLGIVELAELVNVGIAELLLPGKEETKSPGYAQAWLGPIEAPKPPEEM